jgi:uroporphyrinogen decarboxylase
VAPPTRILSLGDTCIRPRPDFRRLEDALYRRAGGETPFYELFVNTPVMEKILGKKVPDRPASVEFYYRLGYDYVPAWPTLEMPRGDLVDTTRPYPIADRASFRSYPWPDPSSITFGELDAVGAILPAGMKIIAQTGGVFETAEQLFGYQRLCTLLYDDRALVRDVFARIGELYVRMYDGMAAHPLAGAVVISDDLGYKGQTLIGPEDLRELVLPWHSRLAEIIHSHGKPCILHSCGNLEAIMEDVIGTVRIDAKHSYEDTILPAAEAKRRYGDRIAILGGFDVDRLCRSTPEQIRAYVDLLLAEAGRGGGYALGSGNSIPEFVPVEHYLTMLDQGWRRRTS